MTTPPPPRLQHSNTFRIRKSLEKCKCWECDWGCRRRTKTDEIAEQRGQSNRKTWQVVQTLTINRAKKKECAHSYREYMYAQGGAIPFIFIPLEMLGLSVLLRNVCLCIRNCWLLFPFLIKTLWQYANNKDKKPSSVNVKCSGATHMLHEQISDSENCKIEWHIYFS